MYGLVLEGGGAKGSYHIGVYKGILEEGIDIQGIAGTSIGALNGAMIVQGDFHTCYNLWDELSSSMILTEDDDIFHDLAQSSGDFEDMKQIGIRFLNIVKGRGFGTEKLKEMLDKYIDEDKIRESNMDFGIVTFNLTDMKPVEITIDEIPYGDLKDYLMASAYLPVFKAERLGGKLYIDGAIYDNLPFRILQRLGYEKLILVRTHARGITRKINKDDFHPIIISPSDDIGYSFTFDVETARRNIKLGYYDALRAFRNLRGDRYYIEDYKEEDMGLNFFLSLGDKKIDKINKLLGEKYMDPKRNFLEHSLVKLGSILGLNHDYSYDDLLIAILEKKAESLSIERFKLYSLENLIDLVRKTKKADRVEDLGQDDRDVGILERIIEKVDIASSFNKDDLILELGDLMFRR